MSTSDQVTRYKPAIIAMTGVAAICGIWAIWNATTPSQPLRRSNAVRRPRRQANASERIRVTTAFQTEEQPLGIIEYHWPEEPPRIFRTGLEPLPTAAILAQTFNCNGNDLRNTIASQAIWSILAAASISHDASMSEDTRRTALLDLGIPVSDIVNATSQHDATAVERCQTQISALLGGVESHIILDSFQHFPSTSSYMRNQHVTMELDDDDVVMHDYPETEQSQADTNGFPDAEPSHGLKGLLFFVAEEQAKRAAYEHRGITCEGCNESPIKSVRWHCINCPDFDLCSTCEATHSHDRTHLFVKIRTPIPALAQPSKPLPVWYPGDTHLTPNTLSADSSKHLREAYMLDGPHLDALYDQFVSIANVACHDDPSGIDVAITRSAFDKAMTSDQWTNLHAPNMLYERMFEFYDVNARGLIVFKDFVSGVSYLRGHERFKTLDRALKGYDFDNDRYLDRSDFLRLLREKYVLTRNIASTAALLREAEKTHIATEVLASSQPISSLFAEEAIPQGRSGSRRGKQLNSVGDLEPGEGVKTVLDDADNDSPASSNSPPAQSSSWRDVSLSRLQQALQGTDPDTSEAPSGERTDSKAVEFTDEEAALVGLAGPRAPRDTTATDLMWRIIEEGFHEMLDPMFKSKELLGWEVLDTMDEREKWRPQIDEVAKEQERFEEKLRTEANSDPLMATALASYAQDTTPAPVDAQSQQQEVTANMREGMVPTDPESLEQLESEIHSQPLDELLSAAGYSVAADDEPYVTQTTDRSTAADVDTTLPHHRPNSAIDNTEPTSEQENTSEPRNSDAPPSQERLAHLAQLDREWKAIKALGGPGRLSFEEIKAIVAADNTRQLKGLVTSWLEWASF